ncbi:MAG: beta-lactamase family protein [Acidimicrobiia bacterium]|nr:beta-lactamase family protein [Acidimicrobiia bacterium]
MGNTIIPAMIRRLLVAVVSCAALVPAVAAQDRPDNRFEAIVELTQAKMKEFSVPGVALGIFDQGRITTRALGVTNVEDPIPVNDHTVFPIASISKTFAATMVMRLVEQGKLDLKTPVRTYLPEFKVGDESVAKDVTAWNLLTHTAGWEGQVSSPERGPIRSATSSPP